MPSAFLTRCLELGRTFAQMGGLLTGTTNPGATISFETLGILAELGLDMKSDLDKRLAAIEGSLQRADEEPLETGIDLLRDAQDAEDNTERIEAIRQARLAFVKASHRLPDVLAVSQAQVLVAGCWYAQGRINNAREWLNKSVTTLTDRRAALEHALATSPKPGGAGMGAAAVSGALIAAGAGVAFPLVAVAGGLVARQRAKKRALLREELEALKLRLADMEQLVSDWSAPSPAALPPPPAALLPPKTALMREPDVPSYPTPPSLPPPHPTPPSFTAPHSAPASLRPPRPAKSSLLPPHPASSDEPPSG